MDRYRKAWIAALGFLATLLTALDQALDVGIVPESWGPWLVVAITAAAALGVERIPNAPPWSERWAAARSRDDTGATSPRLLAAFLAVAGLVTVALAGNAPATASPAGDAHAKPRPAPHIRVTSAVDCEGILTVGYGLEDFVTEADGPMKNNIDDVAYAFDSSDPIDAAWVDRPPVPGVRLELHHIGASAGPGGHWDPPANLPFRHVEGYPVEGQEIEGQLVYRVVAEPTWDAVRVILPDPGWGDVASSQALATPRCPA